MTMRALLGGAAGLAALALAGLLAIPWALETGALTARLDAALERATGRAVSLGPISVRASLRPAFTIAGATIANPPGLSRPDFASIGQVEITLGLLPLLAGRVEIDSVTLAGADILLERDAEGRPNWLLAPPARDEAAEPGMQLSLGALQVTQSRIALAGQRALAVPALELRRQGEGLGLTGRLLLAGKPFALDAAIGALADPAPPLRASLAGEDLRLAVRGTLPRNLAEPGWSLALEGDAADPARLAALLSPGLALPKLGPVHGAAALGPGPALTDIRLSTGATSLGAPLPGLRLKTAALRAATPDAPAMLTARLRRGTAEAGLAATLPSLRRLVAAGPAQLLPVEATLTAGAASLTLRGEASRTGVAPAGLAARLAAPDLAALGPLLGMDLPGLREVVASARLGAGPHGLLRFGGLAVTAAGLDLAGEVELATAPRTVLTGRLAARRLDLDALGGARPAPPRRTRLIPDVALPVAALRGFDATLALSAEQVTAGGIAWRGLSGQLTLAGGRLAVQPFTASLPGGTLTGRFSLDAAAAPPDAALSLRSQALDLGAVARGLGNTAAIEGQGELALDLRGRGTTLRAVAATLGGEAGLAVVEGRLVYAGALRLGPNLVRTLLPRGPAAREAELRCLALRLTAEQGAVRSQALLLEGGFGRIDGDLAVNLRDETLAARLLPDISVLGGVTLRTPVGIGGTLAAPRVGVEPGAALARVAADALANRLWRSSTVAWLRGPGEGDCAAQLRLARLGREGRVPPAAPAPVPLVPRELQGAAREVQGAAREVQGAAQDVLRGIGGLFGVGRR
ncbi:AsmA family protein [Dankookia sp. GCM10030260]|uniref:AsmA family protein n=1 Tax=Dankookia sp. GCM10030260 TaxID=3273390 RepID=UPI00360C9D06